MEVILSISLIAGFSVASFLFAVAESAFFSLGQWQIRRLAKEHADRGELVSQLLFNPKELISSLALGSTFANCVILGLGLRLTIGGSTAQIIGYGLLLLAVILGVCEILPKTLAVRAPERWALRLAKPVWIFQKIALPVRDISQRLVDLVIKVCVPKKIKPNSGVSDEEYAELLDWAYQQGVLDRSERDAMQEIIQLDRRTAEDVMKPRSEMASIDDDLTLDERIAAAREHKFTSAHPRLRRSGPLTVELMPCGRLMLTRQLAAENRRVHRAPPSRHTPTPDTRCGVKNTGCIDGRWDLQNGCDVRSVVGGAFPCAHPVRSVGTRSDERAGCERLYLSHI